LCVCGQNILLAAQQKVHKETFKKGSDSDWVIFNLNFKLIFFCVSVARARKKREWQVGSGSKAQMDVNYMSFTGVLHEIEKRDLLIVTFYWESPRGHCLRKFGTREKDEKVSLQSQWNFKSFYGGDFEAFEECMKISCSHALK
jgi:hypothetical protein